MPGCGTREYRNISKTKIDKMLADAASQGAVITGYNPWDIEARLHGIVLQGRWNETEMTLAISVVDVNWYVPCETIWSNIDAILHGFIEKKKNMEGAMDFG